MGLIFVSGQFLRSHPILRTQRCYQVLCTCCHATKEGRQHAKPLWFPGTDLRLNMEVNKLESVVYMCKVITERVTIIIYLLVLKNFEGAEEDGDSVAETNLLDTWINFRG